MSQKKLFFATYMDRVPDNDISYWENPHNLPLLVYTIEGKGKGYEEN